MRSGRPHLCSFETVKVDPLGTNAALTQQSQAQHTSDEIRNLRAEVAHLKQQLSNSRLEHTTGRNAESHEVALPTNQHHDDRDPAIGAEQIAHTTEPSDPRNRSPRGYYSQHSLFQSFTEVRSPFFGSWWLDICSRLRVLLK